MSTSPSKSPLKTKRKDHSWAAVSWSVTPCPDGCPETDENGPIAYAECQYCRRRQKSKIVKYTTPQDKGNAWRHTTTEHADKKPLQWRTNVKF